MWEKVFLVFEAVAGGKTRSAIQCPETRSTGKPGPYAGKADTERISERAAAKSFRSVPASTQSMLSSLPPVCFNFA